MFQANRFELHFMYGGIDGSAVRVVFGISHATNPRISPHGIAALIQRTFPSGERRGFVPMLNVDDPSIFIVSIAQIGRYRVSTDARRDAFNPYNPRVGDVGGPLEETVAEWARISACYPIIDCLQAELKDNPVLRQQVRDDTLRICEIHGIPLQYDLESLKNWNSKDKTASSVSAIFQVGFLCGVARACLAE